jgi:hypothetical protein
MIGADLRTTRNVLRNLGQSGPSREGLACVEARIRFSVNGIVVSITETVSDADFVSREGFQLVE